MIAAPSSTKNQEHARDPEMQQTKKGNQWYFGLKAHVGVDKESGLVHTLVTTSANVSDISQTPVLLHGQEEEVWLDAGYVGVEKREDMQAALAANEQEVKWHIARRRKSIEKMAEGWQGDSYAHSGRCGAKCAGKRLELGVKFKNVDANTGKIAKIWSNANKKCALRRRTSGIRFVPRFPRRQRTST